MLVFKTTATICTVMNFFYFTILSNQGETDVLIGSALICTVMNIDLLQFYYGAVNGLSDVLRQLHNHSIRPS